MFSNDTAMNSNNNSSITGFDDVMWPDASTLSRQNSSYDHYEEQELLFEGSPRFSYNFGAVKISYGEDEDTFINAIHDLQAKADYPNHEDSHLICSNPWTEIRDSITIENYKTLKRNEREQQRTSDKYMIKNESTEIRECLHSEILQSEESSKSL